MKVKIGNKLYDSNEEPIMLILTDDDKQNIAKMLEDKFKFISYPTGTPIEKVREFIDSPVHVDYPQDIADAIKYCSQCESDMGFMGSPKYYEQKELIKEYFEKNNVH